MVSGSHTVIEVNGRDRPGLLFELTRALTRLNLQVSSAKISTYGEKVVDVFYVKNLFGHKIEHSAKLAEIQRALEAVLVQATSLPQRWPAANGPRPNNYSRRSSKNSFTRAKKPSLSG
jgi:[protein-PII] uridylyltransferase